MTGWWRRDPRFIAYLLREATAIGIVAYAVVLLVGLASLQRGPASFACWLDWLASPTALVAHAGMLICAIGHSWTWFGVLPRTLPRLPAPDAAVRVLGRGAAVLASLGVLLALRWLAP